MNATAIVMIITVAAALVLAARMVRSHDVGFSRTVLMGVVWAVIIAVLAYVLQRSAP